MLNGYHKLYWIVSNQQSYEGNENNLSASVDAPMKGNFRFRLRTVVSKRDKVWFWLLTKVSHISLSSKIGRIHEIVLFFLQVPPVQNQEPGWMAGEIRGHTGWFPEAYVEPVDPGTGVTKTFSQQDSLEKRTLEWVSFPYTYSYGMPKRVSIAIEYSTNSTIQIDWAWVWFGFTIIWTIIVNRNQTQFYNTNYNTNSNRTK